MAIDAGSAGIYTDLHGLGRLREAARAGSESPETLREVARQFESLFIQMMLKNMRAASFGDELFDSDQSAHYRDMFDSQISLQLGRQGGFGLADLLVRQLGGEAIKPSPGQSGRAAAVTVTPAAVTGAPGGTDAAKTAGEPAIESPEDFVRVLRPHAIEAAARLGIEPEVLLAQAALETGWGRRMITRPDGSSSHNLFGIKADGRWDGDRVSALTLEYEDGIASRRSESFRAYASFAESFADYVNFLQSGPRYEAALAHDGDSRRFIDGLHRAGYATDPEYAAKINRILNNDVLLGAV